MHERQSAALLHALEIHSKVMLYIANSGPHLLTLLFAFFPFKNFVEWFVIIPDYDIHSLEIIIPFGNDIINSISFLFSCAPFSLHVQKVCERKAIGNSVPPYSWDNCPPHASYDASARLYTSYWDSDSIELVLV